MVPRILAGSRYIVVVAVIGTFLSSVTLVVSGALTVVSITWDAIQQPRLTSHEAERLAVELIQLIDVFLLGTVLYIVALGLYQLFLDPGLPLPRWLLFTELDELKEKLVGVIIVLLAVAFLGEVINWDGQTDIFPFGTAVALVIASLGLVIGLTKRHRQREQSSNHE